KARAGLMVGSGAESRAGATGRAACALALDPELITAPCPSLAAFSRVRAQPIKANPATRQIMATRYTTSSKHLSDLTIIRLVFRVGRGAAWDVPAMQYRCSSHTAPPWAPRRCTCLRCRWSE